MNVLLTFYRELPPIYKNWVLAVIFLFSAWLLSRLFGFLIWLLFRLRNQFKFTSRTRPERQKTLRGLLQGIINVSFFIIAILLSLGRFVETSTLVWMVGLFGAGIGLAARPLLSDIMAGASFIFDDTFAVGEKVELLGIEGIIEAITLRTTWLRSPSGEQYSIPNGDIRVIRNFSRGRFSLANVSFKIHPEDISRTLEILQQLGKELMDTLPNLLEPWQVISKSGEIGLMTELSIIAKARFGKAAEMRTRLMTLIQTALAEENIAFTE